MAINSKVIWSEGMFLSPQHFQQQDRYFERYVENRCSVFNPFGWGVQEFKLDQQLLGLGKIVIESATGVFPDGTPFNFPEIDETPSILEVPDNVHNCVVYMGIPLRRSGTQEVQLNGDENALARYQATEHAIHDAATEDSDSRQIQVGKLRIRLLLETEDLSGFACIGLFRIIEKQQDKQIKIDKVFIPANTDITCTPVLHDFLTELLSLLRHRAEAISVRLADSRKTGTAEVSDYLLLQVINRYEPLVSHFKSINGLHPENLYACLLQIAGDLSTFTTNDRRPPQFPVYTHDNLEQVFKPIINFIRQCLSMVYEQTAVSLNFIERKYGIRVAEISDRGLIDSAAFILAVKADMPAEVIRNRFPQQVKIGSVERIRQLVNAQMPGIGLQPLSVAPRQIPFHSGFTYFQLDSSSAYWQEMRQSGGFALHIGAEYPGIELEFWAIRE